MGKVKQSNDAKTHMKKLRSSGFRVTEPRLRVIDSLSQAANPMTAKEIYDDVSRNIDERVDVATIYRILERFTALGICHQVGSSGKYMICHHDDNPEIHVLLQCTKCAEISEAGVPKDVLTPLTWFVQNNAKFRIQKSLLQMDGLCNKCVNM